MLPTDPYLLRILVGQHQDERLRDAGAERLTRTLGGGDGTHLGRPRLRERRLPRFAHGHRRPALH